MPKSASQAKRRASHSSQGGWRRVVRSLLRVTAVLLFIVAGVGAGIGGVRLRLALRSGEVFALKQINIQGAAQVPKAEIMDYAGLRLGDGLYAFSLAHVERAIEEHPLIARARLLRRPPHELRIFVIEQKPVAYVEAEKLYAVNAQGQVFARAEALAGLDLPVLTGIAKQDLQGDHAQSQIKQGLKLIDQWGRAGFSPQELGEVHFDPALGVSLELGGELRQVHLGVRRWEQKLNQLRKIRSSIAKQGKRLQVVRMGDGADPRRVVVRFAAMTSGQKTAPLAPKKNS